MGTGGARYGAGRPGWRRKCEQLLGLDVRKLVRARYIRAGYLVRGNWQWTWTHSGEPSGNVGIEATYDQVRLTYTWTPDDSEPQTFEYAVAIERTACNYGGTRAWLLCPRCGRRSAILYGVARDGRFGCRICMRLGYASETEDAFGRSWRTQRKLAARLGAKDDTDPHPPRPKGMRERTYQRILGRIWDCEARRDEQVYLFMQRHGFKL